MPYSISREGAAQILRLEGAMTIRHAQELASRLEGDLAEGVPVSVETGGLVDIDTCILQLLCALRKTVPALSFESPSEAFAAAVERTGLRRELLGAREAS